jgi:signal transduction histidine kinase
MANGDRTDQVLIVEDTKSFQHLLSVRLRAWRPGIKIVLAEKLSAARKILDESTEPFMFVILDQHLPDGMGYEIMNHEKLSQTPVLAVSSDDAPELPAETLLSGASHFLPKSQISEDLFIPLIEALIARSEIEQERAKAQVHQERLEVIRNLVATLRHEINNPLGAVLGASFILRSSAELDPEQKEAVRLIEDSSNRIKHVLNELCNAAELEEVAKGRESVYQIPGDPKWKD